MKKTKKVIKEAALIGTGVKVATKVSKDAPKVIAVAKTVKKIEKKVQSENKSISVKIDPELNNKLEKYCKKNKLSKNAAVIKAIEQLMK